MKIFKPLLSFLEAILILLASFSVYTPGLKTLADHMKADMYFSEAFSFEALTADEAKISDAEKQMCRNRFNENLLTDETPAYDFAVDGKHMRDSITDWNISVGSESEVGAVRAGGKTVLITLKHKKVILSQRSRQQFLRITLPANGLYILKTRAMIILR